jgi:hypothetical protein
MFNNCNAIFYQERSGQAMSEHGNNNRNLNFKFAEAMTNRINTLNSNMNCITEFIKIKEKYDIYLKEIYCYLPDSEKEIFDKLDNCLKDMLRFYESYYYSYGFSDAVNISEVLENQRSAV